MVRSKDHFFGLRRRRRPQTQHQQPNLISSNHSYQAYHQDESPSHPSISPNNYPFNSDVPEVLPETTPNSPRITSPINYNVNTKTHPTNTPHSFPSFDSQSQQEHDLQKEPISFPSLNENQNQSDLKKIATVVPLRVNDLRLNSSEQSHQHPQTHAYGEIRNPINLPETEAQPQLNSPTSTKGSSHKHFRRFLFSKLRPGKYSNNSKDITPTSSNQVKSDDERSITSNTSSVIKRGIRGGVSAFLRNQRNAARIEDIPDVDQEIFTCSKPAKMEDPPLVSAPPPNRVVSVTPDARIRDFIATSTGYVTDIAMTIDGHHIPHPYSHYTAKIGEDLTNGSKCNDGYIQFTVPPGWVANRTIDGFYLLKGTAIGFIRAVQAKDGIMAVMNTGRLQVMSQISVLTSPSFVSKTEAMVKYVSHIGEGVGYVKFNEEFTGGAIVIGLCGPSDEMKTIEETIATLKDTSSIILIPTADEPEIDTSAMGAFDNTYSKVSQVVQPTSYCPMQ